VRQAPGGRGVTGAERGEAGADPAGADAAAVPWRGAAFSSASSIAP
jgi:hypothetical protein